MFGCNVCNTMFASKRDLTRHSASDHSDAAGRKLLCHECANEYAKTLNRHMRHSHVTDPAVNSSAAVDPGSGVRQNDYREIQQRDVQTVQNLPETRPVKGQPQNWLLPTTAPVTGGPATGLKALPAAAGSRNAEGETSKGLWKMSKWSDRENREVDDNGQKKSMQTDEETKRVAKRDGLSKAIAVPVQLQPATSFAQTERPRHVQGKIGISQRSERVNGPVPPLSGPLQGKIGIPQRSATVIRPVPPLLGPLQGKIGIPQRSATVIRPVPLLSGPLQGMIGMLQRSAEVTRPVTPLPGPVLGKIETLQRSAELNRPVTPLSGSVQGKIGMLQRSAEVTRSVTPLPGPVHGKIETLQRSAMVTRSVTPLPGPVHGKIETLQRSAMVTRSVTPLPGPVQGKIKALQRSAEIAETVRPLTGPVPVVDSAKTEPQCSKMIKRPAEERDEGSEQKRPRTDDHAAGAKAVPEKDEIAKFLDLVHSVVKLFDSDKKLTFQLETICTVQRIVQSAICEKHQAKPSPIMFAMNRENQ